MNFILAELIAGAIMITYVYCIKYTAQGSYIAYVLAVSWSFVLFMLLWIMFYCNDIIANHIKQIGENNG